MTDDEFLRLFGDRVREERTRRGLSRKMLADRSEISERYITQLESGKGNVSILLLRHIASALGMSLSRLLAEEEGGASRAERVALVGLRGAGKSTLGAAVARQRGVPFFELDREVERISGSSLGALFELYGQEVYRRYELEALQELLASHPRFVVATGGGIVSEAATYDLLLRECFTVWVRTSPEEHMGRVIAQGDRRPMAASRQAMDDLRRILEERTPLYARADVRIETTGKSEEETVAELLTLLPEK